VQARDVGLGGEEDDRWAARLSPHFLRPAERGWGGGSEELERERALGVDAHGVDAGAGEGRELGDDGVDLRGVQRHARSKKCRGRRAAAAASSRGAEPCYFFFPRFIFFAAGFLVVFFFVAFFFAGIGAPSSESPFDLGKTP